MDSVLDKKSSIFLLSKTYRTVDDLEGLIEGYSNVFEEDSKVEIASYVTNNEDLTFDETFGNVAFKMS